MDNGHGTAHTRRETRFQCSSICEAALHVSLCGDDPRRYVLGKSDPLSKSWPMWSSLSSAMMHRCDCSGQDTYPGFFHQGVIRLSTHETSLYIKAPCALDFTRYAKGGAGPSELPSSRIRHVQQRFACKFQVGGCSRARMYPFFWWWWGWGLMRSAFRR